jgi:hypothetical protein
MGWLFRKRLRLGKFVSINLSKSGVGLSVGPPGAKLSVNPKRARVQVGIPGTGVGYRKDVSLGPAHTPPPPHADEAATPELGDQPLPARGVSVSWLLLVVLIVGLLLGVLLARGLFR